MEAFVSEIETLSENSFLMSHIRLDREILMRVIAELVNSNMNEAYKKHYDISWSTEVKIFLKKFLSCCKAYSHYSLQDLKDNIIYRMLFKVFLVCFSPRYKRYFKVIEENQDKYNEVINLAINELSN